MSSNGIVSSIQDFDELKESGFNENQARGILKLLSKDAASKEDLKLATTELKRDIETVRAELKRDIKEVDTKIETVKAELKKDIKELDTKIETVKAELKKDIETVRYELKRDILDVKKDIAVLKKDMIIIMGTFTVAILGSLVTLSKLGLLTPPS